jgi:outer membrane protein OmpA-like peptidoglycan-associated protein
MYRRSNPWPSFVDLFSALLLTTLGGLVVLWSGTGKGPATEAQVQANRIMERVVQVLGNSKIADKVRRCGEDTCVDLYVHFAKDKDSIDRPEELVSLKAACNELRGAFDNLRKENPKAAGAMQLIIEGHADRSLPKFAPDARTRDLYNWKLSAARAAAVLWEFRGCGLSEQNYPITAVAKGDTDPICKADTESCYSQNRRTTLRLQVDTRKLPESAAK